MQSTRPPRGEGGRGEGDSQAYGPSRDETVHLIPRLASRFTKARHNVLLPTPCGPCMDTMSGRLPSALDNCAWMKLEMISAW